MSAAKTLHLIEKLTEANISKETATELLEYVEQKQADTVTRDYFEAKITALEDKLKAKITALEDKLEDKITALEDKLEDKIIGLRLFTGFNTALLLAVLAKLFLA